VGAELPGSNSVMEMVEPGRDQMSFWSWLTKDFLTRRYGGTAPPLTVASTERISEPGLVAEAATLVPELASHVSLNPVSMHNTTVGWHAWDLWRVKFDG